MKPARHVPSSVFLHMLVPSSLPNAYCVPPALARADMGAAAPMAALFGDDNMGADGGGEEGGSYEELCRAHIEAMMAAAAAREVQTELAQRVST